MSKRPFLLFLLVLPFLMRCATVGQPSGGDIDKQPPTLIEAQPDSFTTHFSGKRLVYHFDEYFVLENPSQAVLISPPLRQLPEFTTKKKSLVVDINEDLKPNTTYQINFGKSIKDLNEGNVLEDFRMVFSTGADIDSLQVGAVVRDAYTKEAIENVSLMLFPDTLDSALTATLPYYYSRTNASGEADLTFLPAGRYNMFAVEDKNGNYLWDKNEQVAFLDSLIVLPEDTGKQVSLRMFQPQPDSLILLKARRVAKGHYSFGFNLPVDTFSIKPAAGLADSSYSFIGYNKGRDTIDWFYYPAPEEDTGQYALTFAGRDTLIRLATIRSRASRDKGLMITASAQGGQLDLGTDLILSTSIPVLTVIQDSIQLMEDSVGISFQLNFLNDLRTRMRIKAEYKQGKHYFLMIPRGTMVAASKDINDSVEVSFSVPSAEDYGNIMAKITVPDSQQVLVQLVKNKNDIIREAIINSTQNVSFRLLRPGNYKLQAIVDWNKNGKWDSGNLGERRQPEDVVILAQELNVRANWDLLDLNFMVEFTPQPAP